MIVRARLGRVRRTAEWQTVRSWRRVDWNAVCHDLLLSDWSLVEAATDVNECVEQFMVIWDTVMDRHCPPRRVRVRGSTTPGSRTTLLSGRLCVSVASTAGP